MVVLAPQKFALLFTLGRGLGILGAKAYLINSYHILYLDVSGMAIPVSLPADCPLLRLFVLPWQLFSSSRTFSFLEAGRQASNGLP
jgi:hypothetical protein